MQARMALFLEKEKYSLALMDHRREAAEGQIAFSATVVLHLPDTFSTPLSN